MPSNGENKTFFSLLKILFILFISSQTSVSTQNIANKTGKGPIDRINDKFYRYFNKNFDELSNRGSDSRHSNPRPDQKLNISITIAEPYNEFTELQSPEPLDLKEMEQIPTKPQCQCSCDDPYKKANQLISDFVLKDIEDPDMDIDDNEELEKLQKPYKYIPMETIELAHQRPQRVTSTPAPPPGPNKLTNLVQSMSTYLSFPKFSTTDYLELGLSLAVTGLLGVLGMSSLNPYQHYFRRNTGMGNTGIGNTGLGIDRNSGFYNKFYIGRQMDDTFSEDTLSLIYNWIKSLD